MIQEFDGSISSKPLVDKEDINRQYNSYNQIHSSSSRGYQPLTQKMTNNVAIELSAQSPTQQILNNNYDEEAPTKQNLSTRLSNYFQKSNSYFILELFITFTIGILGHFSSEYIFRLKLNIRDIPYQITQNGGDFIFDSYINRPLVSRETIPDWALLVIAFIAPVVILPLIAYFIGPQYDVHSSLCVLFLSMGMNTFLTEFVKLYVGYFRPNFYNYCEFDQDTLSCLNNSDPRKSFPSGHASSTFCTMTVMSLYLLGKISLFHVRKDSGATSTLMDIQKELFLKRLKCIVAMSPMFLAVFVAASRVHDDYHHPADVVAGALIGIITSSFCYGLWYPFVFSWEDSGNPLLLLLMKKSIDNNNSS